MNTEELTVVGDWERKKILGRGSFGEVILWRNKTTKEFVAIKKCIALLNKYSAQERAKLRERWNNELEIMHKAKRKYIVTTLTVEPPEFMKILEKTNNPSGFPLVFMEYCDGGDVRQLLTQIKHSNGLLETDVRLILKTLRDAVEYLQSINITHRDLKPENIVIQHKNDQTIYKLADLGYAKEIYATYDHSVVGTSGYLAPEITCKTTYSRRVDYWSMGIIAFEIICGIRPFIPHQTLQNWAIQINQKTSKHIAITENNFNEFLKHEHLFPENQISNYLQYLIEHWLVLALDTDAKQRGSVFVKTTATATATNAPDEALQHNEITESPKSILKFYTLLDQILCTKILTIFCLTSYKYYSYPLPKYSNLNELKVDICKDTGIPLNDLYLILPIEHKINNEINEQTTKPMDLYLENHNTTPMLYVIRYNFCPEFKRIDPYISTTITDVLKLSYKNNVELKSFYLKEFARQLLYLLRNEQKHYTQLLIGLQTYVINLNHAIIKFKQYITQINNQCMITCGNINMYIKNISYSREKIQDLNMENSCPEIIANWDKYCEQMKDDLMFCEINAKNQKGYESVLRRSQEIIDSKCLINQEFFKITEIEEFYGKLLMVKSMNKESTTKHLKYLIQHCHDLLSKRRALLTSRELENLYKNIISIHVEFIKIKNITESLHKKLDEYDLSLQNGFFKHQDDIFEILKKYNENMHKIGANVVENHKNSIANMDFNVARDFASTENLNFELNSLPVALDSKMTISCFGESNKTRELIDEAAQISTAFSDLISDLQLSLAD